MIAHLKAILGQRNFQFTFIFTNNLEVIWNWTYLPKLEHAVVFCNINFLVFTFTYPMLGYC